MGFWGRIFGRGRKEGAVGALRERLHNFRELVEKNNRVLELIADAGEMLGGEYVFDIQYLKTLAGELEEAVRSVVYNLNAITTNRYPELVERVESIAAEVQAAVEARTVVPRGDYVVPLEKVEEAFPEAVGEKMARLGELKRRLGMQVPDGFVISAAACQRFVEHAGIENLVEQLFAEGEGTDECSLEEKSAQLCDKVRRTELPRELSRAIRQGLSTLKKKGSCRSLAVRSSALGEDGELSFAGQYRTVLGVTPTGLLSAYKEVLASLYAAGVMRYRLSHGLHPARGLMAVGCLCLVEARSSGVIYTLDPAKPDRGVLVVSAARGLGKTVVDGSAPVDTFELSREPPRVVLSRTVAAKEYMYVVSAARGLEHVPVPDGQRQAAALSDAELGELARIALRIEKYMKCAQDIEWAVDEAGGLCILQTRALRLSSAPAAGDWDMTAAVGGHPILLQGQGTVACRGIGCGRVHLVTDEEALEDLPSEVVLVARTSSPRLAAAMARASAVITDLGTATGHLAAIAREFRVPAIVDTGTATQLLEPGQELTVDAEENVVYEGRVKGLLDYQLLRSSTYEDTAEFRLLRRMLKRIAPLCLKEPQSPDFTAAGCATYHDVIRFAHEKAAQELSEGSWLKPSARSAYVRRLELELPLDLILIDLGGGLSTGDRTRTATCAAVTCAPLRELLEGLRTEGVWGTGPADMDLEGFMSSMTRGVSLTGPLAARPEQNLAIISAEYLHLSLRLGYHFNIVDCYLGEQANENYIYFRFAGGVTELTRRSRRSLLLKTILSKHDFVVEGKGDLVIGRIKKLSHEAMVARLRMIGRLIGFTRQLDILLRNDDVVQRCVNGFLEGRYDVLSG